MQQKNIGTERVLQKIKQYCASQDRSQKEVIEKLYSFGLYKQEAELMVSQLIRENYLNDERYALNFARGKFRIKHWGSKKIKYELQQNKISGDCIRKALEAIDETEYKKTLQQLFQKKEKTLKAETNTMIKRQKLFSYLVQKGFEPALINDLFKN